MMPVETAAELLRPGDLLGEVGRVHTVKLAPDLAGDYIIFVSVAPTWFQWIEVEGRPYKALVYGDSTDRVFMPGEVVTVIRDGPIPELSPDRLDQEKQP